MTAPRYYSELEIYLEGGQLGPSSTWKLKALDGAIYQPLGSKSDTSVDAAEG
jgi:hypothetical protein